MFGQKKQLLIAVAVTLMLSTGLLWAGGSPDGGAAGEQVTELEFWMPGQEATIRSTMEGLIDAYESDNPGVTINYTQTPWNDWFTKMTAAIAGNTTPDVTGLGYGQFGMLVSRGVLAPVPNKPEYELDDVADWAIQAASYQGQQHAVFLPATKPLTYRRSMFEEAGLDPNRPPRNWEELREYAEALVVRDANGQVTRAGIDITYIGSGEQIFLTFLAQRSRGAHLWEDGGRPVFNTPEGVETLEYLVSLRNEYNVVLPSDVQNVMGSAFEQGAAAMGYSWSQALPLLLESQPGDIGFALPTGEESNAALTLGTFLAVFDASDNKDEAFDFLGHMYSEESMWDIYEGILFLPTRQSLRERFLNDQPYNEILQQALDNSVSYNVHPKFGEARAILAEEVEQAFYGNKTPAHALADAEQRMLELLE